MNYIEWNDALAKRYFDCVTDKQTFLCITKDTLKDISGLPTEEEALESYIKAVKAGPYWTRNVAGNDHLPGCKTILAKAHNCLHPNPNWKQCFQNNEKLLNNHVNWRDWTEETFQYPPYLAYLLLLVLAWIERNNNDHGLKFYDPLNRILGLEGEQRIEALGEQYTYNDKIITINDLWIDLLNWSLETEGPVIDPPSPAPNDYLSIPKHYGFFNASDLRQFNNVFFELSEKNLINTRIEPAELVNKIIHTPSALKLFSSDGKKGLKDSARHPSLGRLLLSKYRAWDGCPGEDYIGTSRGCHKLLRVLKNGQIQSLIKLRSVKAMERAIIEEGAAYQIDTGHGNDVAAPQTNWPLQSEFSAIFKIEGDDPTTQLEVSIPDLRIKAIREGLDDRPFVLAKQTLVHLLGAGVEIDEVEVGKHYLVLTRVGNDNAAISQYLIPDYAVNKPAGYQAFTLRVPESVNPESWPNDYLPPLAKQREGSKPRIKVESVFAIGRDSYLTGFPITITSTSDDYSIIINPNSVPHQTYGSIIVATPSCSGELDFSLFLSGGNEPLQANKKISIQDWCQERVESTDWVGFQVQANLPTYPRGEIILNDNFLLFSKHENFFFMTGEPLEISHSGENGEYKFMLKINNSLTLPKRHCLTGDYVKEGGLVDIKLFSNDDIIDNKKIKFLAKPSLQISGLSHDEKHPMLLNRGCFGSVQLSKNENPALNGGMISLQFLDRKKSISLPVLNINWLDFLTEGGRNILPPDKVFELQFFWEKVPLSSCWVKSARHLSPKLSRPVVGSNNLGALLDGVLGKNS
jgi:hypothetical protein